MPSLLEVCGFSYFYGGFLVGPQFTLRSYQRLVARELTDCPGKVPNRLKKNELNNNPLLDLFKRGESNFPVSKPFS